MLFICSVVLRHLPPFPTRRSSDLPVVLAPGADRHCPPPPLKGWSSEPMPFSNDSPKPGCVWLKALADRKSTRLNSSHLGISYAVFCLKKKKNEESDRMRHSNLA